MAHGTQMDFQIGEVLGRSINVISRNFWSFYILAIVFACPSTIIDFASESGGASNARGGPFGSPMARIVEFLLMYLLTAVLVFGTIRQLRGGTPRLGEMVKGGLESFPTVIGVTILMTLIIGVPLVLINLPALASVYLLFVTVPASLAAFGYFATLTWVVIPAAVVERKGALASVARSANLTSGFRWQILAIILLVYASLFFVSFAAGAILGVIDSAIITAVVELLIVAAFYVFVAVISAVGYHDLRIAKEGDSASEIAAVFD